MTGEDTFFSPAGRCVLRPAPGRRKGPGGRRRAHSGVNGNRDEASGGLPLPAPDERWSLFLDFDGTLAEIAEVPDRVRVDSALPATLMALHRVFGGALALVSGRPIVELDAFLSPARLPAAGVHGFERRGASGEIRPGPALARALDPLRAVLARLAADDARLVVEDKGVALALHYRRAPEREAECCRLMAQALDRDTGLAGFRLMLGKMVVEAKPAAGDKGTVIREFMREAPFAGRRPVFAGDDLTDEDGFGVVAELRGIGVKVGEGRTRASFRTASVAELGAWLRALANGALAEGALADAEHAGGAGGRA